MKRSLCLIVGMVLLSGSLCWGQENVTFWYQKSGDVPPDGNSLSNPTSNIYYNPRLTLNGEEAVPYHNNATATQWCISLRKGYTSGVSTVNWANPLGERWAWENGRWVAKQNGDYPRTYICSRNW